MVDNFHFYYSECVIPLPPASIVSDETSAVKIISLGLPCPCHLYLVAFWIFFPLSLASIVSIVNCLPRDTDALILVGAF